MAYEDGFYVERQPGEGWKVISPLGAPVGSRFDFYSGEMKVPLEVVRNPFPKELGTGLGDKRKPLTKQQAEDALARLRTHIQLVRKLIPKTRRIGGSQFW